MLPSFLLGTKRRTLFGSGRDSRDVHPLTLFPTPRFFSNRNMSLSSRQLELKGQRPGVPVQRMPQTPHRNTDLPCLSPPSVLPLLYTTKRGRRGRETLRRCARKTDAGRSIKTSPEVQGSPLLCRHYQRWVLYAEQISNTIQLCWRIDVPEEGPYGTSTGGQAQQTASQDANTIQRPCSVLGTAYGSTNFHWGDRRGSKPREQTEKRAFPGGTRVLTGDTRTEDPRGAHCCLPHRRLPLSSPL